MQLQHPLAEPQLGVGKQLRAARGGHRCHREPPAGMHLADVFLVGGCTWTKTTPRSAATGFRRGARKNTHTESEALVAWVVWTELHAFFDAA
ncbi:hypothetical protein TgHK011_009414 [Trichoderma gracile]|nr:hypothetical protein TgHK011_009414 [Trichoderma gracile]